MGADVGQGETDDERFARTFAEQVADLPGVLAVTLGGSRATGRHRRDSDWDFALYYRGSFDADVVRAAGWPGQVTNPGEWGGGVMNGGAWLQIDGRRVDLIYRDLDEVEHWWAEAREGRYEKQLLLFHLAGIPTYTVVGEMALHVVLSGELPRPDFPDRLRVSAHERWHVDATLTLGYARAALDRGDMAVATGNVVRAVFEESHSRLAQRGEWALNEKGLAERAGLGALVADLAPDPARLRAVIDALSAV